ncbi:hypothetical protein B6U99_04425 [Candidatus Geothermarchaeota archaeon ex4572_27]|nr:MAG: hypothetical protein B6U99_04425 [Candidatus Geothermarchaeota archaeon ex4572_27]
MRSALGRPRWISSRRSSCGVAIYGDGTWRNACEIYTEVKRQLGIEKYKGGWRIRRRPKQMT